MTHIVSKELATYADGEVTPMRSTEIQEHLSRCPHCSDTLLTHQSIKNALQETDESLLKVDLVPDVMNAIGQASPQESEALETPSNVIYPPNGFWSRLAPAAMLAAAATVAWVFIVPTTLDHSVKDAHEFRVKTDESHSPGKSQLVGISVYHLDSQGQPVYLGNAMKAAEPLLFAYSNASKAKYQYLMIFAVDSRGQAHWYYPAYVNAGKKLKSIAIQSGATGLELNEKIRHALNPGPLTIYALFSNIPIEVDAIEEEVNATVTSQHWQSGTPIDFPLISSNNEIEIHQLQTHVE